MKSSLEEQHQEDHVRGIGKYSCVLLLIDFPSLMRLLDGILTIVMKLFFLCSPSMALIVQISQSQQKDIKSSLDAIDGCSMTPQLSPANHIFYMRGVTTMFEMGI